MQDTSLDLETSLGQGIAPNIDLSMLAPLLMTSLIVTGVLSLLFLIYIIFNSVRRYKVEKATIDMQKDIRLIRELMEKGNTIGTKNLIASTPSTTTGVSTEENLLLAKVESEPSGKV